MTRLIKRREKLPRAAFHSKKRPKTKKKTWTTTIISARRVLGDDYVSHGMYRDIVAEGFDKRSPSRLAPKKPAYFPIDDPVTRNLAASKYSAKVE